MKHFENRLKNLFDYQRFEKNGSIEAMMKDTEKAYGGIPLSEEDVGLVFAAGEFHGFDQSQDDETLPFNPIR